MQNSLKQKFTKNMRKIIILYPIFVFRPKVTLFDKKRPRLAGSIISFVVKMCYLKKGDHRKYKGAKNGKQK